MIYYVALKPPTADVCVSLMCHLSFCQLRLASVRSNNDVTALNQVIFSLVFSARSSSLALSCLLPQTRQPSLPPSFAAEAYTPRHHNFTRPYVTSLWNVLFLKDDSVSHIERKPNEKLTFSMMGRCPNTFTWQLANFICIHSWQQEGVLEDLLWLLEG